MKLCIFGGHYGSEGKGAAAEYWIRKSKQASRKIAAFGENSPNSGHTCSAGKTKNIPASAFFADVVILGPDTVVNLTTLCEDLAAVRAKNPQVEVYLHEHAAIMDEIRDAAHECHSGGVVERIGSTGSGSGTSRSCKYQGRCSDLIASHSPFTRQLLALGVRLVNRAQWVHLVDNMLKDYDWFFECSQGVLLDTNWGIYPYVTSRTTLPQAAIERNGLGRYEWTYVGVYRTFPIRTGGNSGPTGGKEVSFESIGVEKEIATVTKRVRRVFEFSRSDFELSLYLARPDIVMFTHADYLVSSGLISPPNRRTAYLWLLDQQCDPNWFEDRSLYFSFSAGEFERVIDFGVPDEADAFDQVAAAL